MVAHHFRAQLVFPRAAAVGRPLETWITNLTGAAEVGNLSQRAGQDRFITRAVVGRAEGAAHRMVDKDGARRPDFADDVEGRADDQRGNASTLDDMGDETDGLVAEGSVGNKQG